MEIEIYSDVVCPWCWIGERRLLKALSSFSDEAVTLKWRAFQLDPSAESAGIPLVQWLGRRYGGEANARRMFANVTNVAEAEGLTMHFDDAVSANTFDAHRLIWWSGAEGGDQRPMVEALHRAHFTDGLDIGDRDVISSLTPSPTLTRKFLSSQEGVEEVRAELRAGRQLGITGVPTFVFDGRAAISGAQDPSTFRDILSSLEVEPVAGDACAIDDHC
ncbi:polyketide synthase [Rhizocola hellebori]|uniref:Polyketide synthase n=1 Tax=Rhizocola hellebori TaxID=1392758 RepID=A0A8J3VG32_9ACTN|nr:DsbA family oxidoreductase [Rhizocola hellebori]GIH05919.1 polyketide synthase [Rhizocola hellebori]